MSEASKEIEIENKGYGSEGKENYLGIQAKSSRYFS